MVRSAQLLLLLSACAGSVSALTYRSVSMWRTPSEFLSGWYADPSYDKSGGFIEYVDTPTARANGMLKAGRNGGLWFGVETKAVSDAPRKSLRFRTKAFYGDGLMVVDVAHAPSGCGTWPAIWSVQEENWPFGGEIDIMEQVNGKGRPNSAALHTSQNCLMPAVRAQTGNATTNDCNVENGNGGNVGCSVDFIKNPKSFGIPFNQNGGGTYAMRRDSARGIYIWFWPRGKAPAGTTGGSRRDLDPSKWGTPAAFFPATGCDMKSHFSNQHQFVMNIDLCGPYVEAYWQKDGCGLPNTCMPFSATTPSAFKYAYFDINSFGFWKKV